MKRRFPQSTRDLSQRWLQQISDTAHSPALERACANAGMPASRVRSTCVQKPELVSSCWLCVSGCPADSVAKSSDSLRFDLRRVQVSFRRAVFSFARFDGLASRHGAKLGR